MSKVLFTFSFYCGDVPLKTGGSLIINKHTEEVFGLYLWLSHMDFGYLFKFLIKMCF
jgi:hypothetical protein